MARKYVLDTHALVWYVEGNPRLSAKVKMIIDDLNSELVLPLMALAEAAFLVERGRTSIPSVSVLMTSIQADTRIEIYPLTWDVFQQSLTTTAIPEMHDRLIVGTALHIQNLQHTTFLLTKDELILRSNLIDIIW